MNIIRTTVGKTRTDRVRNQGRREHCEIVDVVRFIRRRKRAWNEHGRNQNGNDYKRPTTGEKK